MPTHTFVEGYDDPNADIVIASNEGDLFRVHSYVLRTYSVSASNSEPIHLDSSTHTLRDLFDLMTQPALTTLQTPVPCHALWKLCDKIGCEILQHRILWLVRKRTSEAPWPVFCVASQVNDLELAQTALRHMDKGLPDGKPLTFQNLTAAQVAAVTPSYMLALNRHMSSETLITRGKYGYSMGDPHWESVAKSFVPAE